MSHSSQGHEIQIALGYGCLQTFFYVVHDEYRPEDEGRMLPSTVLHGASSQKTRIILTI